MESLKKYLTNNVEELKDVVNELNSWNGCLENLEVYENDEEFFNTFFHGNPSEAVRASCYGDYNYMDEYVRFNGYGNLESLNEYDYRQELIDYIDDIVDELINNRDSLYLSDTLAGLLENEVEC